MTSSPIREVASAQPSLSLDRLARLDRRRDARLCGRDRTERRDHARRRRGREPRLLLELRPDDARQMQDRISVACDDDRPRRAARRDVARRRRTFPSTSARRTCRRTRRRRGSRSSTCTRRRPHRPARPRRRRPSNSRSTRRPRRGASDGARAWRWSLDHESKSVQRLPAKMPRHDRLASARQRRVVCARTPAVAQELRPRRRRFARISAFSGRREIGRQIECVPSPESVAPAAGVTGKDS